MRTIMTTNCRHRWLMKGYLIRIGQWWWYFEVIWVDRGRQFWVFVAIIPNYYLVMVLEKVRVFKSNEPSKSCRSGQPPEVTQKIKNERKRKTFCIWQNQWSGSPTLNYFMNLNNWMCWPNQFSTILRSSTSNISINILMTPDSNQLREFDIIKIDEIDTH